MITSAEKDPRFATTQTFESYLLASRMPASREPASNNPVSRRQTILRRMFWLCLLSAIIAAIYFRTEISTRIAAAFSENKPAAAADKLASGAARVGAKDHALMLYVPAGSFTMGSEDGDPNEWPVHLVHLDAFWIDQTEVTNGNYARCVADGYCTEPVNTSSETHASYYGNPQYSDYPVIYVNYLQATNYCRWTGRRLPTEAEWEKAARAPEARLHPWGSSLPEEGLLNFALTVGDTSPAGTYPGGASPYGALDMEGNVLEWTADCFDPDFYSYGSRENPTGPSVCEERYHSVRGSRAWNSDSRPEAGASDRMNAAYDSARSNLGFRCAAGNALPTGLANFYFSDQLRPPSSMGGLKRD